MKQAFDSKLGSIGIPEKTGLCSESVWGKRKSYDSRQTESKGNDDSLDEDMAEHLEKMYRRLCPDTFQEEFEAGNICYY